MIYADYAATAPMRASAKAEYIECMEIVGNPSSIHKAGRLAAEKISRARAEVASMLNCHPSEVFFTSGGTESDNWALRSTAQWNSQVVTTTFEHHAILHTLDSMTKSGSVLVRKVSPEPDGIVDPGKVAEKLAQKSHLGTNIVSVMAANNEIGTIQPIAEIVKEARRTAGREIIVHTDAVQAVGHIQVDVKALGVDMLSLSGHKFGGPKGVGVLYCDRRLNLAPFMYGGGQEMGRRPGTENVAAIAGMAVAMREACENIGSMRQIESTRDFIMDQIAAIPGAHINGSRTHRLPGNINFRIDGVEGEVLVMLLNLCGVCVSAGSACSSGSGEPSHVMTAIGQNRNDAHGAVRITIGEGTTQTDAETIVEKVIESVAKVRKK